MSVMHGKIISDTMKKGPVPETKTFLPGMVVNTMQPDKSREVLPLINNIKTPGAGTGRGNVMKREGPRPKTIPRSFGQTPYSGKLY